MLGPYVSVLFGGATTLACDNNRLCLLVCVFINNEIGPRFLIY